MLLRCRAAICCAYREREDRNNLCYNGFKGNAVEYLSRGSLAKAHVCMFPYRNAGVLCSITFMKPYVRVRSGATSMRRSAIVQSLAVTFASL